MNIENIQNQIEAKSQELQANLNGGSIDDIKNLTAELTELKMARETFLAAQAAMQPVNTANLAKELNQDPVIDGIKEAILNFGKGVEIKDFEFKTTATTSAGLPGLKPYTGVYFTGSSPRTALIDILPYVQVDSVNATYYVQSTRTNNASAVAEGVAPTDNVNTFTETPLAAKPVISWIPVSDALLLSASPLALAQFRNDVMVMCKQALDNDLIDGSTLNSLSGISAGSLAGTGAVTAGSGLTGLMRDVITTGMMTVEAAGDFPRYLLCHPTDWAKIMNQKDSQNAYVWNVQTAEGEYLGMKVVRDAHVAAGTVWILGEQNRYGVVGSLQLETGYNDTDFSAGRKSLRAMIHSNSMWRNSSIYKITIS